MTAAVVASPLLGAAAVNGLCGALVLNDVLCPSCEGFQSLGEHYYHPDEWDGPCPHCRGGVVAPSVTPGQHLAVATTRTEPDDTRDYGEHIVGGDGDRWVMWNRTRRSSQPMIPLHFGSVIGSVTATTPALPIVVGRCELSSEDPHVCIYGTRGFIHPGGEADAIEISEWLPWLGDELVGRWAVLIDNPTTTLSTYSTEHGKTGVLVRHRKCPVPLPDDVDLTEGTIVEVDL